MKELNTRYIAVDRKIHLLVQLIAKASRSFIPSKPDDSHTNLSFDEVGDRIRGRWINSKLGRVLFSLELSTMTFQWLDSQLVPFQTISVYGKALAEIENEIAKGLLILELDSENYKRELHFEITDYSFKTEQFSMMNEKDITLWRHHRSQANMFSNSVSSYLQYEAEPRIWPHHFDTGIYAEISSRLGIGFGLAMSDSMVGDSYYYLAGYGLDDNKIDYKNMPDHTLGSWYTKESWKGYVLPLSELAEKPGKQLCHQEFKKALDWYLLQS